MSEKDDIINQLNDIRLSNDKRKAIVLLIKLYNIYESEGIKFTESDLKKYTTTDKNGKLMYSNYDSFKSLVNFYNNIQDNNIKINIDTTNRGLWSYWKKYHNENRLDTTKTPIILPQETIHPNNPNIDSDHCSIKSHIEFNEINDNIPKNVKNSLKEFLNKNPDMWIKIILGIKNKQITKIIEIE